MSGIIAGPLWRLTVTVHAEVMAPDEVTARAFAMQQLTASLALASVIQDVQVAAVSVVPEAMPSVSELAKRRGKH